MPEADVLFSKVIEINSKSYYLVLFTAAEAIFHKCTV